MKILPIGFTAVISMILYWEVAWKSGLSVQIYTPAYKNKQHVNESDGQVQPLSLLRFPNGNASEFNLTNVVWGKTKLFVDVHSRLGNKLFVAASVIGLSLLNNRTPVVSKRVYKDLARCFQLSNSSLPFTVADPPPDIDELPQKNCCVLETRFLNLENKSLRIRGGLQSWRYFFHVRSYVRTLYKFHSNFIENNDMYLRGISNGSDVTFIGVHIRRGDKVRSKFFVLPPLNYTYKAMSYFKQKYPGCQFVVCSDSIDWCKEQLSHLPDVHFSVGRSPFQDLCLLSQCNHTIVHEGTFGWWGAWLAGGEVVYHDICYTNPYNVMYAREHYFLPEWIPMH